MVSDRNPDLLEETRMPRNVRSILALLVLLLFLGTGAAHALPSEGSGPERAGMLVAIWDWVASLLGTEPSYRPVHEAVIGIPPVPGTSGGSGCDYGGYIDPNGCPASGR